MLLYYLVIRPLSALPLWLLHKLSDFLYFIIYRVVGYRKKIVRGNLKKSLPNYSEGEILRVEKLFYKHLMDIFVESIKCFGMSNKEIQKRSVFKNPEIIQKYIDEGKPVVVTGAHFNNWELTALSIPLYINNSVYAIYTPLSNKFIDEKMKKSRSKTGLTFVSPREVKGVFENKGEGGFAMFFLSDQSPSNPVKAHWMTFLNQDTAVLFGCEKYTRDYNSAIIYMEINKVKRGYYETIFTDLTHAVDSSEHGNVTEISNKKIEETILKAPQYWLWSHRRWKHKRPN